MKKKRRKRKKLNSRPRPLWDVPSSERQDIKVQSWKAFWKLRIALRSNRSLTPEKRYGALWASEEFWTLSYFSPCIFESETTEISFPYKDLKDICRWYNHESMPNLGKDIQVLLFSIQIFRKLVQNTGQNTGDFLHPSDRWAQNFVEDDVLTTARELKYSLNI